MKKIACEGTRVQGRIFFIFNERFFMKRDASEVDVLIGRH